MRPLAEIEPVYKLILDIAAELRIPAELALDAAAQHDDVGDASGEAGDAERCAIDQLDPLHRTGGDARQRGARVVRFARDALAVDQHIFGCLAEPAIVADREQHEVGNFLDHIERAARGEIGEIGGGEVTMPSAAVAVSRGNDRQAADCWAKATEP